MTKTAGIACDNYKVEAFKKALKENGFDNFEVIKSKLTGENISLIKVTFKSKRTPELTDLVNKLEKSFKRKKK